MLDPADRNALWEDFAEHFLDTETRHLIPASAERCVRLGLSIEDTGDIWRYEVAPVVWPNLWSVAGEWAGWDRAWLTGRILALRGRFPNRPGTLANLIYRSRVHFNHRVWVGIAACMRELQRAAEREREQLAGNLGWLARHYFDCGIPRAPPPNPISIETDYRVTFLPIFERLVWRDKITGESRAICGARVQTALRR
jgi:hypothetical protein